MKDCIHLPNLELKTFTEQDVIDYCQINNINPDKIIILNLYKNKLTDISGIKLFKNLQHLLIWNNRITDISVLKHSIKLELLNISNNEIKNISVIQYLTELKILSISSLELESDQIQYIKSLNKLKELLCRNGFKDMNITNKLNKNIGVIK